MKKFILLFSALIFMTSCTVPDDENIKNRNQQEINSRISDEPEKSSESGYVPLNYDNQIGIWLPYMDFEEYMYGKTEQEYRSAVSEILERAAENDINTIYFHAHPNGDAYYNSEIFPKGIFYDGDYDPLEIITETAHNMGISVHAWINPYRMQTTEQMEKISDDFIVKQWIAENNPMVKVVGNRYYLNPAYDEVTELICFAADEILDNYNVDGLHIDDYFYPTTEFEFDREAFETESGDINEWRRENINHMVSSLYETVKSHDMNLKFGVSPQGNIDIDYNNQYADVERWTSVTGYCDYIVPQLYFGFENAVCPFEETLHRWESLVESGDVSLIVGLAAYKQGKYDQWAGAAGENEWIDNDDVIERQIEFVKSSAADGYAFYE
ncbi:MAG: family 10 glycosylhydrolase [Ruminococcus sp.]|nr:family 10 glycosylhydrolase [Ruminococcus sp.]MDE6784753.1 family 10 glycosylhydrolase [Ruminococcus sp.]